MKTRRQESLSNQGRHGVFQFCFRDFPTAKGELAFRLLEDGERWFQAPVYEMNKRSNLRVVRKVRPLRVGFLPVNDCAPLAAAAEYGYFKKYGLSVELQRAAGWREMHDKLIYQEMEAAHAPGALPFLINLGVTPARWPCVTGVVLSLQGNAITLSRELWEDGVRDAASLGERMSREQGKRTYAFAVDLPFSSEYFLLCQWLRAGGLAPLSQVRILKVPPAEMFPMLKLGYIDGYCVGEPWTSLAVQAGAGMCAATSAVLAPVHPEKILLVREEFSRRRAEEHERLIAALLEACAFCDEPENRKDLCELLAQPQYVNAPIECLQAGLLGPLASEESQSLPLHGLNIFSRYKANDPSRARAGWITGQLHKYFGWRQRPSWLDDVFRRDIYLKAVKLRGKHVKFEGPGAEGDPSAAALATPVRKRQRTGSARNLAEHRRPAAVR